MTGGTSSRTVTSTRQVLTFPQESVAVKVTVVTPAGKNPLALAPPLLWSLVMTTPTEQSVKMTGSSTTSAPQISGSADTVRSGGQVSTGGNALYTVISCVKLYTPTGWQLFSTVQVLCTTRQASRVSGISEKLTVTSSHVVEAVSMTGLLLSTSGSRSALHMKISSDASGQVMCCSVNGLRFSKLIVCAQESTLPEGSLTTQVRMIVPMWQASRLKMLSG